MYQIVSNMIDHVYQTNYGGDQQYIYYICGALICVMVALISDFVYRVFRHFWR